MKNGFSKSEIAAVLAGARDIPQSTARMLVNDVFAIVADAICAGEKVNINEFGTFAAVDTPARTVRNPKTGTDMPYPASKRVRFHPSKTLVRKVREG